MIYEFALEPKLVAGWVDKRKEYRFFKETLNVKAGRIASRYPEDWWDFVWYAFHTGPNSQNQNKEKDLEILLGAMREILLVKRQSTFPQIEEWLLRAENEHRDRPFRAIIATENHRGNDYVLRPDEIMNYGHAKWEIPGNPETPRTAEEIARRLAPILMVSRHIVLVDPYFKPEDIECRDTLQAILNVLLDPRRPADKPIIELHTGIKRLVSDDSTLDEEKNAYNKLKDDLIRKLPQIIPYGMNVQVVIWKERDKFKKHQKLHSRYLLTEIAGVFIGYGLRRGDDLEGDINEDSDDILLLSDEIHYKRRQQYASTSPAFDLAGTQIYIVGSFKPARN